VEKQRFFGGKRLCTNRVGEILDRKWRKISLDEHIKINIKALHV
jgi:hypothetical protein